MTEDTTAPAPAPGVRAQRRGRRETGFARRERYFNLMVSGHSSSQIAKMVRTSVATVRREIDRALAERRLDAPESFAQVQVARLMKALRLAEAAVELGELKAVATYLRVVAALDRYHELAAGSSPPRRSIGTPTPCPAYPTQGADFRRCTCQRRPLQRQRGGRRYGGGRERRGGFFNGSRCGGRRRSPSGTRFELRRMTLKSLKSPGRAQKCSGR
jgi:DNA-binding CsgD family transcriptional regulator